MADSTANMYISDTQPAQYKKPWFLERSYSHETDTDVIFSVATIQKCAFSTIMYHLKLTFFICMQSFNKNVTVLSQYTADVLNILGNQTTMDTGLSVLIMKKLSKQHPSIYTFNYHFVLQPGSLMSSRASPSSHRVKAG